MAPNQPPKRTMTQPGMGIDVDDAIPRLDSAEMQRVRTTFENDVKSLPREDVNATAGTPPPSSRARIPREDEEEESAPLSNPRSEEIRIQQREPSPASRPRVNAGPVARQQTVVGLGSKTHPQSHQSRPMQPRMQVQSGSPQRSDITGPIAPPPSRRFEAEAATGPRSRKPLTVDSVGDAATRIARTQHSQTAPKVIAAPALVASAPIDSRTAFVLSLVDGTSDVPAIVDAAGMPADEVIGILARLARLGLISVP
jgi:hypothetical protein